MAENHPGYETFENHLVLFAPGDVCVCVCVRGVKETRGGISLHGLYNDNDTT